MVAFALRERADLAARCVARMRSEITAYHSADPADLVPGVSHNVELLFGALAEHRAPSDAELAQIAEHGRDRARLGVPIDDLLRGWRVSIAILLELIAEFARANGIPDPPLLQLITDVHARADSAMVAAARGHRDAELELAGSERDRRFDLVRGILHGTLSPAELRVRAGVYGLDLGRRYHALHARAEPGQSLSDLERPLRLDSQPRHGLATVVEGDLIGFIDHPPRELPGYIGLGPPDRLDHLEESFRKATRALTTAVAFGLPGVHDLAGLGLRAAIVADPELGDELRRRYVDPLSSVPPGLADSLTSTIERFLANGQRIEATARELHVHPNTLRHRVKRYEEITACTLREPTCALEVWWALQRAYLDAHRDAG